MTLVDHLRARTDEMVDALGALVSEESPSSEPVALHRCAGALGAIGQRVLGTPPVVVDIEGSPAVRWSFGRPRVLLLGHLDTVWPLGTIERWPFEVRDGRATGPGSFDMKAGIVQGLFALAALDDLDGVGVLFTSDEETGSTRSEALIGECATASDAVLVLEPSADGVLKTARKGVALYEVAIGGRAAHAGLEPERGVNATTELAHQVLAIGALAAPDLGTSVTPTTVRSGTTVNVVPAQATLHVDSRAKTAGEQDRVDAALRALRPVTADATIDVRLLTRRAPLEERMSRDLFATARRVGEGLGLRLDGCMVGGGSDGNITAGLGVPTLDGLGAVGDGAHAEGEHIVVDAMAERAALVAALVAELVRR